MVLGRSLLFPITTLEITLCSIVWKFQMFNLCTLFYTSITIVKLELSLIISELPPLIFSMVENTKFQCRKYWKKL